MSNDEILNVHGPLYLVWLAGNGQLDGKTRQKKYREKIRSADVVSLKNHIFEYIPGSNPEWKKPLGLKKLAILVLGLTVIHKLQVEFFTKHVEIMHEKYTKPVFIINNIDVEMKSPIANKRAREDLNLTMQNKGGFGEYGPQIDTRVLKTLRKQSETLDPMAHTFNEKDLPQQPEVYGNGFCNSGEFEDVSALLSSQVLAESLIHPTGRQETFPLQGNVENIRPEFIVNQEAMVRVDENHIVQGSQTSTFPKAPILPLGKKVRRCLKFMDDANIISNKEMLIQIKTNGLYFEEDKAYNLWQTRPLQVQTAVHLHRLSGGGPEYKKLMNVYHNERGMNLIHLPGRRIFGGRLNSFLKNSDSFISKNTRVQTVERRRLELSGSIVHSMLGAQNPYNISNTVLLPQSGMHSGSDLLLERNSSVASIAISSSSMSGIVPCLASMSGIVPCLAVQHAKSTFKTFKDVVPPGRSRQFACHYFFSLLELQKQKHVFMDQMESYGEIKINYRTLFPERIVVKHGGVMA